MWQGIWLSLLSGQEWARVHGVSRIPAWAGRRTTWGQLVGSITCILRIVLVTSAFTC